MQTRIRRIAAGAGGDATLLTGSEKTALLDTGMAYYGDRTASQIATLLEGRPLDYILASHTHYDHIGAIPYLRKQWPKLTVLGSKHAQYVLTRPGALKFIRQMSEHAAFDYFKCEDCPPIDYLDEDMKIDRVVGDGDVISLGDMHLKVLETPGHTNCSLSFYIEEDEVIFAGESIGCYSGNGFFTSAILTSYQDALKSIEKCRRLQANEVISPHYGRIRTMMPEAYFDLAANQANTLKTFILQHLENGIPKAEILALCKKNFWPEQVRKEQPEKAFTVNTEAMINVIEREFFLSEILPDREDQS